MATTRADGKREQEKERLGRVEFGGYRNERKRAVPILSSPWVLMRRGGPKVFAYRNLRLQLLPRCLPH